jgi:hypothetical protein
MKSFTWQQIFTSVGIFAPGDHIVIADGGGPQWVSGNYAD